jgi:hypothetical protein
MHAESPSPEGGGQVGDLITDDLCDATTESDTPSVGNGVDTEIVIDPHYQWVGGCYVYVEDIDSSDAEVIPVKEEPVVTAPPALEQEEDGDLLLLVAAPWETKEPDSDVTGFVQVVDDIQIVVSCTYGGQKPEITKANIVTLKGGQLYFGGRLNFDIHDKSKSYVNLDWRYTPEQRALVTAVAEKLLKEQKMLIVADGVDLRQQVAKLV